MLYTVYYCVVIVVSVDVIVFFVPAVGEHHLGLSVQGPVSGVRGDSGGGGLCLRA